MWLQSWYLLLWSAVCSGFFFSFFFLNLEEVHISHIFSSSLSGCEAQSDRLAGGGHTAGIMGTRHWQTDMCHICIYFFSLLLFLPETDVRGGTGFLLITRFFKRAFISLFNSWAFILLWGTQGLPVSSLHTKHAIYRLNINMWQSEYVDYFTGAQHVRNITGEICRWKLSFITSADAVSDRWINWRRGSRVNADVCKK